MVRFQHLDKPWCHVAFLLHFLLIAETVERSRLLVDFHRVLPTNPMNQENVILLVTTYCCGDHIAKLNVVPMFVRVVLVQQQYDIYTRSCGVGTTRVWYLYSFVLECSARCMLFLCPRMAQRSES